MFYSLFFLDFYFTRHQTLANILRVLMIMCHRGPALAELCPAAAGLWTTRTLLLLFA